MPFVLTLLSLLGLIPEEVAAVISAVMAAITIIKVYQFLKAAHRI